MKKRGIPQENLLELSVKDDEECSREEYEKKIVREVHKYLKEKDPKRRIRCLLTMYGLPLRVSAPVVSQEEKREIERLSKEQDLLEERLMNIEGDEKKTTDEQLGQVKDEIALLKKSDQEAALDSELALVLMEEYSLAKWTRNPFFAGFFDRELMAMREKVLLVSRLDGPTEEAVRRIIDESIAAEETGLQGKAYFDARWPMSEDEDTEKSNFGYKFCDRSIHKAADLVRMSGRMPVVINEKPTLFQPGECPDAALYCGWYSLGQYVDAFNWQPGAVGYHIASAECATLKKRGSQVWCKRMLEEGVAATIGPVNEPYVQAFPVPDMFFEFLLDG
jgi:uncharacterized protein (TIGR03790 family)